MAFVKVGSKDIIDVKKFETRDKRLENRNEAGSSVCRIGCSVLHNSLLSL